MSSESSLFMGGDWNNILRDHLFFGNSPRGALFYLYVIYALATSAVPYYKLCVHVSGMSAALHPQHKKEDTKSTRTECSWRHGGAVGYLSASQLEGPGFDSRLAAFPTHCGIVPHTQKGGVGQRAFLCGVCMFSPCLLGYVPRIPHKNMHG